MLLRQLAPVLHGTMPNGLRVFVPKPGTDNEIEELKYRVTTEFINERGELETVYVLRGESVKDEPKNGKLYYREIAEL